MRLVRPHRWQMAPALSELVQAKTDRFGAGGESFALEPPVLPVVAERRPWVALRLGSCLDRVLQACPLLVVVRLRNRDGFPMGPGRG